MVSCEAVRQIGCRTGPPSRKSIPGLLKGFTNTGSECVFVMAFYVVISYHECEESIEADRQGPASARGSPSLWRPRSHPPSKYVLDFKAKEARDFCPSLHFSLPSV